jgi:uncharacterized membrane protein
VRFRRRPTAEEFAALLRRIERIEQALGIENRPEAEAAPPPRPPEAHSERPALESRIGLAWINRIGVITLILGAGFFFKLAVENQWIGEAGRVILGAAVGAGALAAADRLWRHGQQVFAQGITAAGIAILYLTFYASFALYGLIPAHFAFLLMAATTMGAAGLALRYGASAIAALGLFGGYATPLLLATGTELPWFYLNYLLLLDVAAIEIGRRRQWRLLVLLALAATIVLFGSWLGQPVEHKALGTIYTLLFYGLFTAARQRAVFFTAQALAALTLTAIWPTQFAGFAVPLTLLAAAGLAISDRRGWRFGALVTAVSTWCAQALWYGGAAYALAPLMLQETLLFALFLGWVGWRLGRGAPAGRAVALLPAFNAAFYFSLLYAQLRPAYSEWAGLAAVALAAAHMLLARKVWSERAAALMLAGIGWALLVLAVPIQFGGWRVAMVWSLEATAMAWVAARFRERRALWAAGATFALALLQLPWGEPHLLPYATTAAGMWAAANWWRSERKAAVAVYVTGHTVMLWGLVREVFAWAMRAARPEDFASFASAASTILMAAYAVGLVAVGVFTRSALNRLLGLGLIGVVIAKLYFYDVWLLGRVYRVAAFAALGALLLGMSYLYSRYRTSIESWWRAGEPRA